MRRPTSRCGPACAGYSATALAGVRDGPVRAAAGVARRDSGEPAECYDRLIVPHWERIRPCSTPTRLPCRATGRAAPGRCSATSIPICAGPGQALPGDAEDGRRQIMLGPDGLVLMPSVFTWPQWSVKRATSTQTTLVYPARGAAAVWDGLDGTGRAPAGGGPGSGRGAARRGAGPAARHAPLPRHHHGAGPPPRRHAERGLTAPGGAAPRRAGRPAAQRADGALPGLRARARPAGGRRLCEGGRLLGVRGHARC